MDAAHEARQPGEEKRRFYAGVATFAGGGALPAVSTVRNEDGGTATARAKGKTAARQANTLEPYDADQVEFLTAIEAFKVRTGRAFPTWTEALGVLKALGYVKPIGKGVDR